MEETRFAQRGRVLAGEHFPRRRRGTFSHRREPDRRKTAHLFEANLEAQRTLVHYFLNGPDPRRGRRSLKKARMCPETLPSKERVRDGGASPLFVRAYLQCSDDDLSWCASAGDAAR